MGKQKPTSVNLPIPNFTTAKSVRLPAQSVTSNRKFLDRAGFILALIVLFAVILEIIFIGFGSNNNPIEEITTLTKTYPKLFDPENKEMREYIKQIMEANRSSTNEMSKTILINVLLPLLTAILGYIFGSKEA